MTEKKDAEIETALFPSWLRTISCSRVSSPGLSGEVGSASIDGLGPFPKAVSSILAGSKVVETWLVTEVSSASFRGLVRTVGLGLFGKSTGGKGISSGEEAPTQFIIVGVHFASIQLKHAGLDAFEAHGIAQFLSPHDAASPKHTRQSELRLMYIEPRQVSVFEELPKNCREHFSKETEKSGLCIQTDFSISEQLATV